MDQYLFAYLKVMYKQTRAKLVWIILAIAAISFAILFVGMLFKPKYETNITIYADNQNVIKPLLEGQAAITTPKTERVRIVQETMYSPRILEQVINVAFPGMRDEPEKAMEAKMSQLRNAIEISAPASNYIRIAYQSEKPQVSYRVVNRLTTLFIEESANTKRSESKSAFTFIDNQVKSYKAQLVEAENKLQAFEAANVDGIESQVNTSIDRLRASIDEISIDKEAEEVRISALEEQLSKESRYASNDYNARVYRDRLAALEAKLDTMLLNYRDQHPDVVDLKLQIQDVKRTIVEVESAKNSGTQESDLTGENRINPIYEDLSTQLSAARVNVQTMQHRLTANQNRLEEQYKRRARIATNQAEYSELTRDYSVTKQIYEDLLERKEKARISMTLDMAGQGVSYKILEPAVFPVSPIGIRFLHFVIAGPIAGFIIIMGIVCGNVLLNAKLQFAEQLNEIFPGIVLAVLPTASPQGNNWRTVVISAVAFMVSYPSAALIYNYLA